MPLHPMYVSWVYFSEGEFSRKKWSETFRPVKIDDFCSKLEMFSNHFGGFKLVFSIEGSQNARKLVFSKNHEISFKDNSLTHSIHV